MQQYPVQIQANMHSAETLFNTRARLKLQMPLEEGFDGGRESEGREMVFETYTEVR